MALQWLHNKSFNGEQATTGSYAHDLYTYIEYAVGPTTGDIPVSISGSLPLALNNFLPSLCLSMQNYTDSALGHVDQYNINYAKNCGRLVCTDLQNVYTNKNWFCAPTNFTATALFTNESPSETPPSNYGSIAYYNSTWNFYTPQSISIRALANVSLTATNGNVNLNNVLYTKKTSNGGEVYLNSSAQVPTGNTNYKLYVAGPVNALYFNATSDIRAKENIKPLPQHMLDLIDHMQVYTFNYKTCEERTIGMIAQDIQNLDIDGFSFVENKEATGENGDFMSIHETKLVYVLLEAVKELSAEVKQLKERLGE